MEMKMLVVCTCGTKLRVLMSQYLQMRCPNCKTMLAEEIERQASRNSKTVFDMAALLMHDRLTAKRWTHNDEAMCRVLARHEIESHGGQWPPPAPPPEDTVQMAMPSAHEQSTTTVSVEKPRERTTIKKLTIKVKAKKRRRRRHEDD